MESKFRPLFILLALAAGIHQSAALGAQFFRISGPAATRITAFRPDGSLVWSNSLTGTNYTVQIATSLQGGTNWASYVQIPVTQKVNTNQIVAPNPPAGMVLIPAGLFTIGNTVGDGDSRVADAIPTNVYVSAFYMDVNLVSSNLWATVYNYAIGKGYTFENYWTAKAGNHPVEKVFWYDCVKWCNARSQQAGLTPVYYTDAGFTQVYTNGELEITNVNWAANGYRLPTEAEWEKAARGGVTGNRFPWGNFISETQANYYGATSYSYNLGFDLGPNGYNSVGVVGGNPYTSPVGSFPPNGYGLYDMAGNLSEWCWDWYAPPPYPTGSAYLGGSNPIGVASGPTGPYSSRVTRGGNCGTYAFLARTAARYDLPGATYGTVGFRCVRR